MKQKNCLAGFVGRTIFKYNCFLLLNIYILDKFRNGNTIFCGKTN